MHRLRLVVDRLAVESFDTRTVGGAHGERAAAFAETRRSRDPSCVICDYSAQPTCGDSCDDPSCVTWCATCAQYVSCVGICA